MAMGTNDQWEAATMGYQNVGPNYWKGEEGRLALIKGEQKLTDPQWVAPFAEIASGRTTSATASRRRPTPTARTSSPSAAPRSTRPAPGRSRRSRPRSRAPSRWAPSRRRSRPRATTCYISDHVDIAIGMNAASPNADAAKTFLEWVGTPEFAQLYANALPGFFPLQNAPVTLENPLAQEFVSWREKCELDDPLDLPDPVARHPEPRERDLERLGQRDPRHRDPRGRRRSACRTASPAGTSRRRTDAAAPAPPDRGRGLPFGKEVPYIQRSPRRAESMIQSRITSKAQTTIPAAVRKALGLREGDLVTYRIEEGQVVMTPRRAGRRPLRDLHRVGQRREDTRRLCRLLTPRLAPGTVVRVPFPYTDARDPPAPAGAGHRDGRAGGRSRSCSGC